MEEGSAPALVIRMFGPFEARLAGRPLPRLRGVSGQWLLALLVFRHGREVQRDWLAGTLWPESDESNARYNLRRNLADLRHALGAEGKRLRSPTAHALSLSLAGADVDLIAFDEAIDRGDTSSLEAAIRLYRGPLLEGCLEDWVIQEREVREQAYLRALEALGDESLARGHHASAIRYFRLVIKSDPLRERAQRSLMKGLADEGDYAAATAVYRELRLLLRRELNEDVSPESRAVFEAIRADARARAKAQGEPLQARQPRSAAGPPPLRRIPRPLTELIGRDGEVREVTHILASARLVTLTGAGGVGKTRMAIRIAEDLADDFADGVCCVELGSLDDPALVPRSLAVSLGLKDDAVLTPTETLVGHLAKLQMLLVLDNCEHLLPACADLCELLLRACPELRILATSREALGIAGEARYRVPSLESPLPPRRGALGDDRLQVVIACSAPRLFVERTQQVRPGFHLTPQNADVVGDICRRLDGIPLAIELAAARARAMSVEEIDERLNDRFRLLTLGQRAAPRRQQTLQAAIEWSYGLLTAEEQTLLRLVSVFAGGWTLEAAEQVCGACAIDPHSALDLLTQLVDKSLVVHQEQAGRSRYRLLETVRMFGRERLAEVGAEGAARSRHFDYFLRLSESAGDAGFVREDAGLLDRLEEERGNFYAAMDWAAAQEGGGGLALRLATALCPFWYVRGYANEGRAWLAVKPEDRSALPPEVLAAALNGSGALALTQGDYEAARASLQEALALWRELDRPAAIADASSTLGVVAYHQRRVSEAREALETSLALYREQGSAAGVAKALVWLGNIAHDERDYGEAQRLYEECLALYTAQNDPMRVAMVLSNLAVMAHERADIPRALTLYERSLRLYRQVGYRAGIATALNNLGNIRRDQGDIVEARPLLEESLDIRRELEDPVGIAVTLNTLGLVHCALRDYAEARRCFTESAAIYQERHEPAGLAYSLTGVADVEAAEGDPMEAARMLGAAENLRADDAPLPQSDERDWLRIVASVSEELTEAEMSAAWTKGAAMPLSDLPGSPTVGLLPHTP